MGSEFPPFLALALVASRFRHGLSAAREPTSEVTGIVTDQTGAVIQQAKVTFKSDSGTSTTETDASGRFHSNLRSGSYVATTVLVTGFKVLKPPIFECKLLGLLLCQPPFKWHLRYPMGHCLALLLQPLTCHGSLPPEPRRHQLPQSLVSVAAKGTTARKGTHT